MLRTNRNRGFTLLENLLALGIFSIAMIGIIECSVDVVALVDDFGTSNRHRQLADARLLMLERTLDIPESPRTVADEQDPTILYRERSNPLPLKTQDGSELDGLVEVEVIVLKKGGSGRGDKELSQASRWINRNFERR